jgi:hypothetical protein
MEFNSFKHQRKLIVILSILLISGFVISNFVYFCTARASLHREIRDKILPITIERINAELYCESLKCADEQEDTTPLQAKWNSKRLKEIMDSYFHRCDRYLMLLDQNGHILMHNLPAGNNPKTIKGVTGLAAAAGELAAGNDFDLRFQEGFSTTFTAARFNPALNIYVLAQQSSCRAMANIFKALIGNLVFSMLITAIAVFITNMTLNMYVKKIKTLSIIDSELKNINQSQQQEIRAQHRKLLEKNRNLEKALNDVKQLSGLLPICANCKKVRDNKGYWEQLESYISSHSTTEFSHGLCPDCAKKLYPDIFKSDEYYYEKHPRKE